MLQMDYQNTFVSYKDSIKIIDSTFILRSIGVRWLKGPRLWVVKDLCGIICAILTWILFVFGVSVYWSVILAPSLDQLSTIANAIIFSLLVFLSVASHLKAMFTDPGAVMRGNATQENISGLGIQEGQVIYRCPKCVCLKPRRAHHCRTCRRCIRKMDHHCPWINNCVGEKNQKFFILFTMYTLILSIYTFCMVTYQFVICSRIEWKDCYRGNPVVSTVLLVLLLIEGVTFGIFTGVLFVFQTQAVFKDVTGVEHVKKENCEGQHRCAWMSLKGVFGHPFSVSWFSPFHVPNIRDVSMDNYIR